MLIVKGEVRKIVSDDYVKKDTGEVVKQSIVILEPANERNNYEVFLNHDHIERGLIDQFTELKGEVVGVPVELFVNHTYKFHKLIATKTAMPIS